MLGNDYFVIPAFGLAIFICSYLWVDKLIHFLERKSLGSREEIIDILDKMLVTIDKQKVTMILLLSSIGIGFAFFLLLWPNIIAGAIIGVAITIAGWRLPLIIMKMIWEKRCDKVVSQLVDGLTIMANGVRAGLSITQSMERVCINLKGPLVQEFNLVLSKIRLGMSVEEAFVEMGERIPRQDLTMLVTGTNILRETGGNLAETFATIVKCCSRAPKD